jgi:hypothetical protein
MRRFSLLIILTVWSANFCSAQKKNTDEMNYSIEITNYYFGRANHATLVTNQSIASNNYMIVGEPIKTERNLSENEKNKIVNFLKKFPLLKLKKEYVYNGVRDGTQIWFKIGINDVERKIFISNAFQKDLGELVALIVTMLPEDYIGYTKEQVPWEVKE